MSDTFDTPELAERAFYDAFERADLDAMMKIWAPHEQLVCVHPMGQSLRGTQAIARSWKQIFEVGARLRFVLSHAVIFRSESLSVHCVHENIQHGPRLEGMSVVVATNVYERGPAGWRIVAHHGSPDPSPAPSAPPGEHAVH